MFIPTVTFIIHVFITLRKLRELVYCSKLAANTYVPASQTRATGQAMQCRVYVFWGRPAGRLWDIYFSWILSKCSNAPAGLSNLTSASLNRNIWPCYQSPRISLGKTVDKNISQSVGWFLSKIPPPPNKTAKNQMYTRAYSHTFGHEVKTRYWICENNDTESQTCTVTSLRLGVVLQRHNN